MNKCTDKQTGFQTILLIRLKRFALVKCLKYIQGGLMLDIHRSLGICIDVKK